MKLALGLVVLASALTWSTTPAQADVFGPISLLSQRIISRGSPVQPPTDESQQADYAHDPAISGEGRYVAFDGSFGGVVGVWRRDLQSGAVERVDAEGTCQQYERAPCYAELPSISEDGRYVSFTTTAQLVQSDQNHSPDVYVRDMDRKIGEPGAFTLASAGAGSEAGLAYQFPGAAGSFDEEHYGSVASGRSALSADGSKVVFVTTAASDLTGSKTPALQVAVRDLHTKTTELVSVTYDSASASPATNPTTGAPVPVSGEEGGLTYGAVYSPGIPPPPFVAPAAYALQSSVGASISADGSTVAWMGQDVSLQAPVLSAEALPASYAEPLWRRISDGPAAPTRRVTGGSDPASEACAASGETALPEAFSAADPCQGPFRTEALGVWIGGTGNPVPQLSADGMTVAFLAGAPPVEGNFGGDVLERASDLYAVDMAPGPSRDAALRPLTELASGNAQEPATTAPIVDLAISPDGEQVAFTTQRTVFPLGSPAYVSAPAASPGMVELFDADRANDTLTRVTSSFTGGPSEAPHSAEVPGTDPYGDTDGALSPSFSDDGNILAFSSTAMNLVFGDGNTPPRTTSSAVFDGSDVFALARTVFDTTPPVQEISTPPAAPPLTPVWRLGVTASSQKDGSVLLEIQAPGAGQLRAAAQSAVRVALSRSARKHRSLHSRAIYVTVATRTVASATVRPRNAGLTMLKLKLAKRYVALTRVRGGLSAGVTVTLLAPGHTTLHQSVAVSFVHAKPPARSPNKTRRVATPHSPSRKVGKR